MESAALAAAVDAFHPDEPVDAAVDAACADDEHEPDEREDDPDAPPDPDEPEPEETDVE